VPDDPAEKWAMPLGSLAGTRLSLSYTVFFAAAILLAVVLSLSSEPPNVDPTRAASLGVGFWVAGWLAQALAHFGLTRVFGLPLRQLNIGLIGVEATPRRWSPIGSLLVTVGTIASLLILGTLFRLVEGGFQLPVLSRVPEQTFTAPSIGFESFDSIWRSAAWLCWVQAIFQMYPLPRSMGRQLFGALVGICGRKLDLRAQAAIVRRCLAAVALMTLALAIVLMLGEGQGFSKWPLLLLLALMLWVSSRGSDVEEILAGQRSLSDESDTSGSEDSHEHDGVVAAIRQSMRRRQERKRLKQAIDQERSEAIDAQRLDEILNRLHRDGIDALSSEDRKILDRVSENLRRQRQADPAAAPEDPDKPTDAG
jgi:hypothetical protein